MKAPLIADGSVRQGRQGRALRRELGVQSEEKGIWMTTFRINPTQKTQRTEEHKFNVALRGSSLTLTDVVDGDVERYRRGTASALTWQPPKLARGAVYFELKQNKPK